MSNVFFDRLQAEEFLEVYKDVVPDYVDHVLQLSNGPSIALEVRHVCDHIYICKCMYVTLVCVNVYVSIYILITCIIGI